MTQVTRRLPLVQEVWGSNLEKIKSPTRCQRLATAATLMMGGLGEKARRWTPLTRGTRKGIKGAQNPNFLN